MRKINAVTLSFVLLMMIAAVAPAFAKDLNLPPGANRVDYVDGGGSVDIALVAPLPLNYPPSATIMRLRFFHVEMPNADLSFDALIVFFYMKLTGATDYTWQPFAVVTTNQEYAVFSETLWRGSLIKWNVPPTGFPPTANGTNNVRLVAEDVLSVERHGNSVTVNLNTEQQLMRPVTGNIFKLPPFSLELTKVGGSRHDVMLNEWKGYTDASGYTLIIESMGFNADAVFNSAEPLKTGATSNAFVAMHATHTYFPPT